MNVKIDTVFHDNTIVNQKTFHKHIAKNAVLARAGNESEAKQTYTSYTIHIQIFTPGL